MAEPIYPHNIGKEYVWWTERGQVAIGHIDKSITPIGDDGVVDESIKVISPHEITTVRLYVTKRAETAPGAGQFTSEESGKSPEFPIQFHESVVLYAIMRAYEAHPNLIAQKGDILNVADYWLKRYAETVREGKRWADENNVYGFKKVTQSPVFRI